MMTAVHGGRGRAARAMLLNSSDRQQKIIPKGSSPRAFTSPPRALGSGVAVADSTAIAQALHGERSRGGM